MKKTFIILSAFVALMATSCQKEDFIESASSIESSNGVYIIHYTIDGIMYTATIHNKEEEQILLQNLLEQAQQGSEIVCYNGNTYNQSTFAKDRQVYVTDSQDQATEWTTKMMLEGYKVSVSYDEKSGKYTCIAIK